MCVGWQCYLYQAPGFIQQQVARSEFNILDDVFVLVENQRLVTMKYVNIARINLKEYLLDGGILCFFTLGSGERPFDIGALIG